MLLAKKISARAIYSSNDQGSSSGQKFISIFRDSTKPSYCFLQKYHCLIHILKAIQLYFKLFHAKI
jgi:hypothetical protein